MSILVLVALILVSVLAYNVYVAIYMKRDQVKTARDQGTGIMKGAEPIRLKGTTDQAVLMIHGFIGSPTDFGRLPDLLNAAGYTVYAPLLPGHGTDPRDLSKTRASELIDFVREAYRSLRSEFKNVTIIGLSMGAALSVILAAEHAVESSTRLVLLAPYFRVKHFWYYGLPTEIYQALLGPVIPYVKKPAAFKQVFDKSGIEKIIDYGYISTKAAAMSFKIAKQASQSVGKLTSETLVIHSMKDRATDYGRTKALVCQCANAKLLTLERSNHLILWDYDSEQVEEKVLEFLRD